MKTLQKYAGYLLEQYSNYPQGRYVSVFIVRKVESEAIFRTEGSGEPLNREFVYAGLDRGPVIPRIVISKRKQTAVERRTGRELLRRLGLLFPVDNAGTLCALNEVKPCGKCIDCYLYGYAVGGGGAQKSRVITDDAFSLLRAEVITGKKQFNAPYEDGTMRHPVTKEPSTSIGWDEYVKPEAHFLDIETLKDVTLPELVYVLGNILRSSRYGAISSRIGKVRNTILGLAFSDCELFSNLEWVQCTYDILRQDREEPEFPLADAEVHAAASQAISELLPRVTGQVVLVPEEEVAAIVQEVRALFANEKQVKELLDKLTKSYSA